MESGEKKEVWLRMRRKERKTFRNNYIREKKERLLGTITSEKRKEVKEMKENIFKVWLFQNQINL